MRERIVFGIMVLVVIFLFALVFAVLGKGEYETSTEGAPQPALSPLSSPT